MQVLSSYRWPGNIRELQNFIERAVLMTEGRTLRLPLIELTQKVPTQSADRRTLAEVERGHIVDTLEQTKTAIETGSIRDETKKALLPAIDGCRTQIESLDILIVKVLPLVGDSWRERSRKVISSLRQDAKVRKIRSDLQGYIQTLTYYHAAASSTLRPSISIPF